MHTNLVYLQGRMTKKLLICIVVMYGIGLGSNLRGQVVVERRPMAKLPQGTRYVAQTARVDEKFSRLGFIVESKDKENRWPFFDGKAIHYPAPIHIKELFISPDGKRFAFHDSRAFEIDGEIEMFENARIIENSFQFSPNSQDYVYCVTTSKADRSPYVDAVAFNGELGPYDLTMFRNDAVFSPDSEKLAYMGTAQGKGVILENGKVNTHHGLFSRLSFGRIISVESRPTFSNDSKRFAYIADDDDGEFVVVDGVRHPTFRRILGKGVNFSPDSKRYAYVVDHGRHWTAVVDGDEQTSFQCASYNVTFSPDSSSYAYVGKSVFGEQFVVIDGKPRRSHMVAKYISFSPDSKKIAYWACNPNGDHFVVSDQGTGPKFEYCLSNAMFSPDSTSFTYVGMRNKKRVVVVNDQELGAWDDIYVNSLRFTPDSNCVIFWAKQGDKWSLYANGKTILEGVGAFAEFRAKENSLMSDRRPTYFDENGYLTVICMHADSSQFVRYKIDFDATIQ